MNLKSLYRKVSAAVTFVMRSWPPHHKCYTDNEKQQTENGTQPVDAGDKLFLTDSSVSPQQQEDLIVTLYWNYQLIYWLGLEKARPLLKEILTSK